MNESSNISTPIPSRSLASDILRTLLPLLVLGGGLAVCISLVMNKRQPEQKDTSVAVPTVHTVAAASYEGPWDIEVHGLVVPFREVAVSTEVAGRVTFKAEEGRAGRFVAKDTLLVEIDPKDYELEARRLEEMVEQAEASLNELTVEIENLQLQIDLSEKDLEIARRDLARYEEVEEPGVFSDAQIDLARRAELQARNSLQMLANQLTLAQSRKMRLASVRELARTQLETAQLDLKRTKIVAPIDGVVVADSVEMDSYVQKGTPVALIEDVSAVEIDCSLKMDQIYWLWQQRGVGTASDEENRIADYEIPQTPVTVAYRLGGEEFRWEGTLTRYEGIGLDEKTRMLPCRVVVPDPRAVEVAPASPNAATTALDTETAERPIGPPALVRGMYVTVRIHITTPGAMFQLPPEAVRPGDTIWRIENGRLAFHPIRVAKRLDDRVLVQGDGLPPGTRIIVSPIPDAREGMQVKEDPAT